MARREQRAREIVRNIKKELSEMQDHVMDSQFNDDTTKALILEKTIKSWRGLKKLVGEST